MPVVAPYFFASAVSDFLEKSDDAILGTLAASNPFELSPEQRDAWLGEIALLRTLLPPYRGRGSVFFEFSIPRMGKRADVVLLLSGVVCVIEFKVGAREFSAADIDQVWDYALDLKNFHRASHALTIIPILVATEAKTVPAAIRFPFADDRVFEPVNASRRRSRERYATRWRSPSAGKTSTRTLGRLAPIRRLRPSSKPRARFTRITPSRRFPAATPPRKTSPKPARKFQKSSPRARRTAKKRSAS